MRNHLYNQTSPYLLQHSEQPVDWYPWCKEAFDKAGKENKPVFLSIGYSTCHWCHVMAHESFDDKEIAEILNKYYVSIKVDREERPDIDSIYMSVCQTFTGSGGWPTTIIMTAAQKPFFAGTYFPKTARRGSIGLKELLLAIQKKWQDEPDDLLRSAEEVVAVLRNAPISAMDTDAELPRKALRLYKQSFDKQFGGFGAAPKFPTPHNLLFLMQQYRKHDDRSALEIAEKTLTQMYRGGIFDHIGYGFSRYSTDRFFLVPHFEKMLYDNALLILAYCRAYELTGKPIYKEIAEKTTAYVLNEMHCESGGFYSAQDADSDGVEGAYYVFQPKEIIDLLGEKDGEAFNAYFGITASGNFEGKSIPNLLEQSELTDRFDVFLPKIRAYRKQRAALHTDDKILTAWNALMIAALCFIYRVSKKTEYLDEARKAYRIIEEKLCENTTLFVSRRGDRKSEPGFLDDYAAYIHALLSLYEVTLDKAFLDRANTFTAKVMEDFFDAENGGFYLYGKEHEALIFRPKESYDGAVPSGNSFMSYNLVKLNYYAPAQNIEQALNKQMAFMCAQAEKYPAGYAMFMTALSDYLDAPTSITVVGKADDYIELPLQIASDVRIRTLSMPTAGYSLLDGQTAFYVCTGQSCLPPVSKNGFYKRYVSSDSRL